MDYLPSEFAHFVERQRALARAETGLVSSGQEGDFALTLMELSAMVAHILGVYQDRYAREAFLGTAQSARSLVRHGRRLGYEPDPGLSATGYLQITIPENLSGTIAKGFAVASAPLGEARAEDYETLEDVDVDAAWNEIEVRNRFEAYTLTTQTRFEVVGAGFGLEAGDMIILETSSGDLSAHTVVSATESAEGATTAIEVDSNLPFSAVYDGFRMYAKPATSAHLFGWDSAPLEYSDAMLAMGAYSENPQGEGSGYVVSSYSDKDIYLARELDKSVLGSPVLRSDAGGLAAYRVYAEASKSVVFRKKVLVTTTFLTLNANNQLVVQTQSTPVTTELSATVSALQVGPASFNLISRTQQSIRASRWLFHFQVSAPLVTERPSQAQVSVPVVLAGLVPGLAPGQLLALSSRQDPTEATVEIAEITTVGELDGDTMLGWKVIEPPTDTYPWTLGELRIRGNVARISHGKTVTEVLGGSDGTTPFLRFALKNNPLTHLPSPDGSEPALELRVGGVLWTPVHDFHDSDTDDRHYLLQRDEAGTTFVIFGDGKHGAIPSAGKRHIAARYRVGLGRAGNANPGQISRIKKAHPLVDRAYNPLRVGGGADAAGMGEIRSQATRFIKTFDRAVSVQDHADLALLFPGVARASAYWRPNTRTASLVQGEIVLLDRTEAIREVPDIVPEKGGYEVIRVVVADVAGEAPGAIPDIKKFLEARRDNTVPLEVTGPSIKNVKLRVYLEIDPAFLPEAVRGAVREALYGDSEGAPGLFTFAGRELGKPAFLSEVYAVITAVAGVAFVEITELDLAPGSYPPRVLDVIPAEPGAWLRLLPQNFDFSLPGGTTS